MRSDIERFKHPVARLDLTGVDFAASDDALLPLPVTVPADEAPVPIRRPATEIGRADAA